MMYVFASAASSCDAVSLARSSRLSGFDVSGLKACFSRWERARRNRRRSTRGADVGKGAGPRT